MIAIALLSSILIFDQAAAQAPTIYAQAQQAMARRDFANAIPLLRQVVAEEPANGRAWNMLGFSLRSAGQWREAIDVHRRALEIEAVRPMAHYHIGLAFAAGSQLDSAFASLMQAKATGRVDMTAIGVDSLARVLRVDPRYAMLFPTAAAFADPFVEPTRIIQEWRGEAEGDQFGWIARNVGDVDGDGAADVVTSAPTHGTNGSNAGKVYVYSGRRGTLLWSVTGEPGAQLGLGVEAAGDVNRDGTPDVIAGAPGLERALVYSGRDGRVLLTLRGDNAGDFFGRRVSDAGDLDRDGHGDVLVGAPNNGAAGAGAGAVYAYSGRDGRLLHRLNGEAAGDNFGSGLAGIVTNDQSWIVIGASAGGEGDRGRVYVYRGLEVLPAFHMEPDATSAGLGGMFVSVVGDVDGDGFLDAYGSDWGNNANGSTTGRIFVHSGRDGRRLLTLTGEAAGDGFGIGPADAGDVDGDGAGDLVIGAWRFSGAAPVGGKVYLYSGRTGALLRAWTGKVPGETFGFDATGMGDVDGDGAIDFLLTSAWSAVNGTRSGRMYIISGGRPPSP